MIVSTHTYTATLHTASGTVDLPLKDGSISMDESWSPHIQASVTIATPGPAVQELMDPRESARVTLQVGVEYDHMPEPRPAATTRTFDLGLRSRTITDSTAATELQLESDEALLQDDRLMAPVPIKYAGPRSSWIRPIVAWVLERIGAELEPGTADFNFGIEADPESLTWYPGTTAWAFLEPLFRTGALRLFCDEQRRWYLVDGTYILDTLLEVSPALEPTEATDTITRLDDGWFDAAIFTYTWTDETGAQRTAYDIAKTPGYTKSRSFEVARPYPGPGAAAYAIKRAAGKGRALDFTALSDYSTRPTRIIFATFPGRDVQTGMVASVTWRLATDEMRVMTRDLIDTPQTAWVLAPVGLTWNDIPAGMAWTDYTPD